MKNKVRATTIRTVVAGLAAGIAVLSGSAPALAAGTNAGLALIVNTTNGQNVNTGGSQTQWTIKLPTGAACSGDTAGNQYHVFGYLVDASSNPNPGALTFNSDGPVGTGTVYPLIDSNGAPLVNAPTAINTGAVFNIPAFNLNLFSIDGRITPSNPEGTLVLPAATYNLGIACTKPDGTGDKYWNTQIVVAPNATDVNGEAWQTLPNPQVPEFPLSVALPLSAAAVLGAGFFVARRRRPAGGVAVPA